MVSVQRNKSYSFLICKGQPKSARRIFVSYARKDAETIKWILEMLQNAGCKVFDPERDSIPGTYVLQNFIDFGIDKTTTAVLFVTKNFLSDSLCTFVANHVIGKYIKSEGRYRVIPVLMENCKLPYYLKSVNCISLWKYKRQAYMNGDQAPEYIAKALSRLLKAIASPTKSFWKIRRSGSKIITHGGRIIHDVLQFGHKLLSRGRKMGRGFRGYIQRERLQRNIPKTNKVNPLNLLKMAASLHHCLISCRYGSCTFQTYGPEYAKFHAHLQVCRFVPVHCKYKGCNVVARRHETCIHEKSCPFIPVECPNDGCKVKRALCHLDEHINICKHAVVPCSFRGCQVNVKLKDLHKHSSVCEFRQMPKDTNSMSNCCIFSCQYVGCEERFHTEQELKRHYGICPYAIINCPNTFCDHKDIMTKIERHRLLECQYRDVKCQVCFQFMPLKHLWQHQMTCGARVKCEKCGLEVRSSSKRHHDLRFCGKQFIINCREENNFRTGKVVSESPEMTSSVSTNLKAHRGKLTETPYIGGTNMIVKTDHTQACRKKILSPTDNASITIEDATLNRKQTKTRERSSSTDSDIEKHIDNFINTKPSKLNRSSSSVYHEQSNGCRSPESLEVFRRILQMIEERYDLIRYVQTYVKEGVNFELQ